MGAPEHAEALRRFAALAQRDDHTIHPRGGSMLLAHAAPTRLLLSRGNDSSAEMG